MAPVAPVAPSTNDDGWSDVPNSVRLVTAASSGSGDSWSDVPNSTRPSLRDIAKQHQAAIASHTDFPPNVDTTKPTPAGPVRRFFQGAGVPTSLDEMKSMSAGPAGPAVGLVAGLVNTVGGEMGTQAGESVDAAQHREYGNAARHALGAAIPLVGPPAAEGNLAGAAGRLTALTAPLAIPAALGEVRGPAGNAIAEGSVERQARVLDPSGQVPEARTIAQQQLDSGTARMTNPRPELAARTAEITDQQGLNATLRDQIAPNALEAKGAGQGVTGVASGTGRIGKVLAKEVAKDAAVSGVGGAIGGPVGGAVGAALRGYFGVKNFSRAVGEVMSSPGWQTASAQLRYDFGKAIAGKDFARAADVGSSIIADSPTPTAPSIPPRPYPWNTPDTATIEQGGTTLPGKEDMSFTPDEDLYDSAMNDTAPEPQSPISPRSVDLRKNNWITTEDSGGNKMGPSTRWPSEQGEGGKIGLVGDPQTAQTAQTVSLLARDTMTSPSFAKWHPADQQAFSQALGDGDVGSAAATANLAERRLGGTNDPALGAINHLPDDDMASIYNDGAVYVDPTGKVTPINLQEEGVPEGPSTSATPPAQMIFAPTRSSVPPAKPPTRPIVNRPPSSVVHR